MILLCRDPEKRWGWGILGRPYFDQSLQVRRPCKISALFWKRQQCLWAKKILSSSIKKCTEASNFGRFFSVLLKNVTYAKKVVKSICELWRIKKIFGICKVKAKVRVQGTKSYVIFLKIQTRNFFPVLRFVVKFKLINSGILLLNRWQSCFG